MPRVIGIDPGTVSIDVCGLDDARLRIDLSVPTAEALADPERFLALLSLEGAPDLIAGPSGYGLPLVSAATVSDEDLRLAFLAGPGEEGGIGGLRRLARALGRSGLPVVYTPGVIHLDTVPAHRKLNRVDLGTADKVATAALGITDQATRLDLTPDQASFILLELGGAFSAVLGVSGGRIVDGMGGTSGPIGWCAPGALDGEVAYLAGEITKGLLFSGGASQAGEHGLDAFAEAALKAARSLLVAVPDPREILLAGRSLDEPGVEERLVGPLEAIAPVRRLRGFAARAKPAAQGAAILADGLAGGRWKTLVDTMRLRSARGTVLDHLMVISPEVARRRLGLV
jgi:predicted butyrate kinase (DUF1464 family)